LVKGDNHAHASLYYLSRETILMIITLTPV